MGGPTETMGGTHRKRGSNVPTPRYQPVGTTRVQRAITVVVVVAVVVVFGT